MNLPAPPVRLRLTPLQWLICGIASLGFAFDTYELLMLPLIVRPALLDLSPAPPGSPEFNRWVGLLFYAPAVTGGLFGFLGGYLTDLLGRRRVLVWSILLYSGSALAAGFATSVEALLALRCLTFAGVCVEFVAAVAWLAELFPDRDRREAVLGYTQAFSSLGGILVAVAYYLAVTYGDALPAINGSHEPWRYTLISGVIPALPLMLVRPLLPESPAWREKRARGLLRRPSPIELLGPRLRRTTLITTFMMACSYGASFGVILHAPRIVPGLDAVRLLSRTAQEQAVSRVQISQELGGLTGRFLLAFLAVRIVARRRLIRAFQVPGLFIIPLVFLFPAGSGLTVFTGGIFLAGLLTIAQFSFWGNYLPRVFPTHLRGTGESAAANIGGRMIGTSAALVTTELSTILPGGSASDQLATAAAIMAVLTYGAGLAASFWLPEPERADLED